MCLEELFDHQKCTEHSSMALKNVDRISNLALHIADVMIIAATSLMFTVFFDKNHPMYHTIRAFVYFVSVGRL